MISFWSTKKNWLLRVIWFCIQCCPKWHNSCPHVDRCHVHVSIKSKRPFAILAFRRVLASAPFVAAMCPQCALLLSPNWGKLHNRILPDKFHYIKKLWIHRKIVRLWGAIWNRAIGCKVWFWFTKKKLLIRLVQLYGDHAVCFWLTDLYIQLGIRLHLSQCMFCFVD